MILGCDEMRRKGKPLAELNLKLVSEWHPTRNKPLTPNDFSVFSHQLIWWKCENGHEWRATIKNQNYGSGCPFCSGRYPTESNSLARNCPDLIQEWHPTKNNGLSPYDVTNHSGKKVWWLCKNGHEWEALVSNRTRGQGCPYCNGKRATKENCLAVLNPILAKEWHPNKNGSLNPWDVTVSSGKSVWWQCEYGHEWKATVHSRNRSRDRNRTSNCPECNKRIRTSFSEQAIYYYLKEVFGIDVINGYKCTNSEGTEIDIYIENIRLGIEYDGFYHASKKSMIRDVKKNQILNQLGIQLIRIREEGVPLLNSANSYGCICLTRSNVEDRKTLEPCIYEIMNYIKCYKSSYLNEEELDKINKYASAQDLFLMNNIAAINQLLPSRLIDTNLVEKCPNLAEEWNVTKNGKLTPDKVSCGSGLKVWWICKCGHEWEATIYNRSNGTGCPYCAGQKVSIDNCLATVNPQLSAEWHPEKNEGLSPFDVTSASGLKVWWLCNKGHEWKATIAGRVAGSGCAECAKNKKLSIEIMKELAQKRNGKCLSSVYKNSCTKLTWQCSKDHIWEATPNSIRSGSWCPICGKEKLKGKGRNNVTILDMKNLAEGRNGKCLSDCYQNNHTKLTWQCEKGHVWQARPNNIKNGSWCPICAKLR